jgi:hypothetical protein
VNGSPLGDADGVGDDDDVGKTFTVQPAIDNDATITSAIMVTTFLIIRFSLLVQQPMHLFLQYALNQRSKKMLEKCQLVLLATTHGLTPRSKDNENRNNNPRNYECGDNNP